MSKRANNEGSIRQRPDGRWEARYSAGYDSGSGKLIRRSIYGKTQAEVRKRLQQISTSLDSGTYTEPNKITLGQWLDIWQTEYLNGVTLSTQRSYNDKIRLHIKPAIGAVKLQSLTIPIIQQFYNSLSKGEKPLSAKTIKGIHGVLHAGLKQAVMIGYIKSNPSEYCTLPKLQKREVVPLSDNDTIRFLEAIKNDPYEAIFYVDIFTGLRQGEILGLTWDCVDFSANQLIINKQLLREKKKGGRYILAPTKTDKARTLTVADSVMYKLREVKNKQAFEAIQAGSGWNNPEGLVFTNAVGGHIPHNTVYKHFKAIAQSIGLNAARFHDLRHSYAVLSLQSGDDIKTVQDNLGHASASFTLSTYAHSTAKSKAESASRTEEYIRSSTAEQNHD